jgi:hypothetical protein
MYSNKRDDEKLRLSLVARTVGTILVSIVIPLVTSLAHNKDGTPLLTTVEQFAVGCFVFIAITATAISYDLTELRKIREAEHEVWYIRNQADEWLQNIRSSFVTLLHENGGPTLNLFAQYFMRIFSSVADDINEAAAKHELRVDELTFGTTDLLIKIMANRGDQTLRLVHALDARPNNFDFTTWARAYYAELTQLAASKKISEIRRLFIYSDDDELTHEFTQCLLAFHSSNAGYDYRVLHRRDWSQMGRGLGLHEADCEIGIWGELLGYTCLRSTAVGLQGVYTCLPRQINRLGELFDAGWRMGERLPLPDRPTPVTVTELFRFGAASKPNLTPTSTTAAIPVTGIGLTGDGPPDGSMTPIPSSVDGQ